MKITIKRRELRGMTTGFSKIISGQQGLPILGCVRFCASPEAVTSEVTDLDQTAVYALDKSAAEGEGDFIVPLDLLRKLSKGADNDTVSFDSNGGDIYVTNTVSNHAVTQTIGATDPAEWPLSGDEIPTAPATGFISAFNRLAPFASTDTTRLALCSVHIDSSEAAAVMVATDGRRLTLMAGLDMPELNKESVIIPTNKFLQWNQLSADAEIGVSEDGQRFCVKAGPWTYRIKAYDGVYPNYRQVIPSGGDAVHSIRFAKNEVKALGQIIRAFPGDELIAFGCTADGEITLCGKDHDGVIDLCIPLTGGSVYKGAGCSMTLNRSMVLDALNAGFTEFTFADKHAPLLSSDGEGGTHVLMPYRICGGAKREVEGASQEPTVASPERAESSQATQQPVAAKVPLPKPVQEKEQPTMPKEINSGGTPELTAFENLLESFEVAKAKAKETQAAMNEVSAYIRKAVREDKARRKEVESVRAGLQKLQSIQV